MGIINGLPYNGGTGSVIDSLESDSRSSALSAYQGKVLLQKISELEQQLSQSSSSIGVSSSDRLETSEIEENVARVNFYLNDSDKTASSEISSDEENSNDDRYVTTEIESENIVGSSVTFNENDKVETEEIVTEDA